MIYVCCGLPRSGSTLQFNILRMIGEGRDWEVLDWVKGSDLPRAISQNRADSGKILVFKTHRCPEILLGMKDEVRVFTTYRDYRDIAASNKVAFNNSVDKTIGDLTKTLEALGSVKASGISIYMGDYDTFRDEIADEVMRICDFLDLEISADRAQEISESCSLEKAYEASVSNKVGMLHSLKRRVLLFCGVAPYKDKRLRLHHNHVSSRRGASDYYREILSTEEVSKIERELSVFWSRDKKSIVLPG